MSIVDCITIHQCFCVMETGFIIQLLFLYSYQNPDNYGNSKG